MNGAAITSDTSNSSAVMPSLELSSPLVVPISASAPAGVDLSYDADFERLSTELQKLTSLSGEAPDWSYVTTECERLLRERSKDLRLVTWLAAAKAYTQGWSGIADGLGILAAVSRSFWPSLHPPLSRLRARAGQVGWLWTTLAKRVTSLPADTSDAPLVRALEPTIAELGAYFTEHLRDADPGISALRIAVREKIRNLPELAAPVVAEVAPTAHAPAPASPAAPPPQVAAVSIDTTTLAGLDQAQDAARNVRDSLTTLAHHARRVAPSSSWPYRLLRVAAWLTVERAPEVENGKTFLRGPKPQDRDQLASLYAAAQWDGLLAAAEDAIGENTFWLDPHRFAAIALERKGPEYSSARQILVRETVSFVERLGGVGGLPRLSFSNGTAFASPETIEWLERETQRSDTAPASPTGGAHVPDAAFDALVTSLTETTGDIDETLARALTATEKLASARSRFGAHLAIAKQAYASDRLDLAIALYERLVPQVNETLEQWEPVLAAEALGGYLKALRAFSRSGKPGAADHGARSQMEPVLFRRLLALDPHAALRLRA